MLAQKASGRGLAAGSLSILTHFDPRLLLAGGLSTHLGHPFARVHSASAFWRAAVAGRRIVIVVKVVIPQQFFSRSDVAQGENPGAVLDLIDLAVGIAGMVQVSAHAFTVDNGFPIFQTIKIGARRAIVEPVGFFGSDARAGIFDDSSAFANGRGGEDPNRMNMRRTDDKSHITNFACFRGWKEGETLFPDVNPWF